MFIDGRILAHRVVLVFLISRFNLAVLLLLGLVSREGQIVEQILGDALP
ncbi:hypothetical protein [Melittangium boletus]|nr:hypothetical protein [Melittangium boletus]